MTLFGAPIGSNEKNKWRLQGYYENPAVARQKAKELKDNKLAKETRIDKVGNDYLVNFIPYAAQRRRMKGIEYMAADRQRYQ